MSNSIRCGWCGKFASKPLVHQPYTEAWKLEPNEPELVCVKCYRGQKANSIRKGVNSES